MNGFLNLNGKSCIIYFKAINGLAKGVYGYKIKQYDKDNNIIMESEFNYFDIGF